MRRIFSGIQPTGIPHIGNYFGALKPWIGLQDDGELVISIVDLHALTSHPRELRRAKREMMGSILATGIDPNKSILYHQSDVRQHTELSWILSTLAPLGALSRMTQFKAKSESQEGNLGLFAYPVLQAADILLYKATHVPVGEDQSQHLELSRSLARLINARMGKDVFPMPKTMLSQAAKINDLRDPIKKMSKSARDHKSRISLIDARETIRKKIMSAVTDSKAGITYSDDRPGIGNLLDIYAHTTGSSIAFVLEQLKDHSHRQLKDLVAVSLNTEISPIRERYAELDIESAQGIKRLDEIAEEGANRARVIAESTMREVRDKLGLSPG